MTFLELCQEVARESQVISGTQPTTTIGQSGLLDKIVKWTRDGWLDVQRQRTTWEFMRNEFSGTLTSGTKEYTPISFSVEDLGMWLSDSFYIYLTATGTSDERQLVYMDWDTWKKYYNVGTITSGYPTTFSVKPATHNIILGPTPDDTYNIRGEYYRSAQTFSANADTPTGLDEEFHQIIIHRALMYMHGKLKSDAGYIDAKINYDSLLDQMRTKYLPTIFFGEPLA